MPINKSAFRRYKVIDMLLKNTMKRYPTMQEIIDACYDKLVVDISIETIQKDIAQMRMSPPDGFDAPIRYNRSKGGYEYTNPEFSLLGVQLSDLDIETIKDSAEYEEEIGRIGSLLYHWKDDFKEHIMSIQHVLYYHQMIPEIRDVHILG